MVSGVWAGRAGSAGHSLHGTAGTLGYCEVSDAAEKIRAMVKKIRSAEAPVSEEWTEVFDTLDEAMVSLEIDAE